MESFGITDVIGGYVTPYGAITYATYWAMKDWIADCVWLDEDELDEWTDLEVIRGVHRHYEGGIEAFIATTRI